MTSPSLKVSDKVHLVVMQTVEAILPKTFREWAKTSTDGLINGA